MIHSTFYFYRIRQGKQGLLIDSIESPELIVEAGKEKLVKRGQWNTETNLPIRPKPESSLGCKKTV